ncbi:HAD family hydrolase [Paenibacillus sp. PDC88]|uniref:HAD family hydrolase n=1 Tax=Paenibacillus sp. PDC88 TaxID=1884375 RepID=UPI00089A4C73|nr:HAD family hydrolase [Paenibacillus sp. PDC88]SDW61874.1 putative hydrolase of the HAD superfamily [Paenibacillus sp. PDC88]
MSIKAVLFDLDDTLLWDERSVEEAFYETCLVASKQTGVDPHELETSVRNEARKLYESYETFAFTKMIGINPFEGLWANFNGSDRAEFKQLEEIAPTYRRDAWTKGLLALGINQPELGAELAEHFGKERRNRPYMYDETLETLAELQGKVKLLLLTNGCPALQQEKLDGVPDLVPYFDHIVISGTFGKGKPDPSIFKHALELLDVSPEEALMVGDKLTTDIKGALASGIRAVWINRNNKLNEEAFTPDVEIKHLSEIKQMI